MRNKQGFTIVEVVVLIAVLVILGALGYMAYNNIVANKSSTASTSDTSNSQSSSVKPVVVESPSDLDTISKELDSLSIDDGNSSSQLDKATNSF